MLLLVAPKRFARCAAVINPDSDRSSPFSSLRSVTFDGDEFPKPLFLLIPPLLGFGLPLLVLPLHCAFKATVCRFSFLAEIFVLGKVLAPRPRPLRDDRGSRRKLAVDM